jgi:hypothetical protein
MRRSTDRHLSRARRRLAFFQRATHREGIGISSAISCLLQESGFQRRLGGGSVQHHAQLPRPTRMQIGRPAPPLRLPPARAHRHAALPHRPAPPRGLPRQGADADPMGTGVARWVEDDFRAYLRCGILAHGFAPRPLRRERGRAPRRLLPQRTRRLSLPQRPPHTKGPIGGSPEDVTGARLLGQDYLLESRLFRRRWPLETRYLDGAYATVFFNAPVADSAGGSRPRPRRRRLVGY